MKLIQVPRINRGTFFVLKGVAVVVIIFHYILTITKVHHVFLNGYTFEGKRKRGSMKVNDLTGEVIENNDDNLALAKREVNELALFEPWLEAKEMLLTAKEKFEMVDVPFRKTIKEIFEKYAIKSLDNPYVSIVQKNGFARTKWDDEKLNEFLITHGAKPSDFKTQSWVEGTLQIKYKDE